MPFRATVVLPFFTNLPTDVATNTWHFESLTLDTADMAALWTPRLRAFYATIYGSTFQWPNFFAASSTQHVNWYDLADPIPRPVTTVPLGVPSAVFATTQMPTEVSCVLSFQGTQVAGVPQSRRRGRVYLGPLRTTCIDASTVSAYPQWSPGFVAAVAAAADLNLLTPGDADSWWAVWSPTTGASVRVDNGWVDNSPDTQRRRGVDPTARTLFN